MINSFAQCPNCGTGQDYRFPDNYESTFCFCSFQDTIVGDTEERIIKLLEAKYDTYPVEQWLDEKALILKLLALIKGENK